MSLGSRIANRGRIAANASLASTPREPLLFLYPLGCQRYYTATASDSTRKHQHPQSNKAPRECSKGAISQVQLELLRGSASAETRNEPEDIQPQPAQPTHENTKPTRPHASTDIAVINKVPISRLKRQAPSAYLKLKAKRWLTWREKRQTAAEKERDGRKQYQEALQVKRGADLPNWRNILATLIDNTPDLGKWLEKAVIITVPESSRETVLKSVDNNIYDIAVTQHGCSLQRPNQQSYEGELKFLLSGPTSGIGRTVRDVMQIAVEAHFDRASESDIILLLKEQHDPVVASPIPRTLLTGERPYKASKILTPSEWTKSSFHDYVERLTSAPMPNHLHRVFYKKGKDHVSMVATCLAKVFSDPKAAGSISRTAFNRAMQYFIRTNRIFDARCLFVRMEMMKIQMDTETFNIMLRGAAKAQDLSNFQTILALMLKRNHMPNGNTFVAFMMAFTDVRIKSYIMAVMDQKGLLNHRQTRKRACEHIVGDLIESSLERNQTVATFLEQMDVRYGKEWLTVNSGNRIVHAIGNRWLISQCWEFVLEMKDRFIEPDNVTLNTILHKCKDMRNIEGAVELIKAWQIIGPLPIDEQSYQALFNTAWRLRMYNTVRVIWKYACLEGLTTAQMRSTVFNSLKVGLGLEFAPSRALLHRDRASKVSPPPRLQGNSDYRTLLLAVEQAEDSSAEQASSVGDNEDTGGQGTEEIETRQESSTDFLPGTDNHSPGGLNRFGHLPNPDNLIKMFHRTAGLFVCGVDNFSSHPAQTTARSDPSIVFTSADKARISANDPVRQVSSLVEVMSQSLSTVHLADNKPGEGTKFTNAQKLWTALRQMDQEKSVFIHWKPQADLAEVLSEAYERDIQWKNRDVCEHTKSLEWMLPRALKVPISTRRGLAPRFSNW